MKKIILFIVGIVCISVSLYAQSSPEIKPLSIGNKVPDIVFHHLLNYKANTANLSDFRDKLVILDFWNTWCSSCLEAFPKMDSLQNQFKHQIQIILVDAGGEKYDGKKRVEITLNNLKKRTGFYPSLPVSILDTLLNDYFPHKTVPHEVWISKEGKVIAITGAKSVTTSNIRMILAGKNPGMEVKNDFGFDKKIPLLIGGNGGKDGDFIYRSLFTGYMEGIGINQGMRTNDHNKVTGYYMTNLPLIGFVRSAYYKLFDSTSQRMILDVRDASKFKTGDTSNDYCYDLSIPPESGDRFNLDKYLKIDLKRAFNISAAIEKRRMKCMVLTVENRIKLSVSYTKYNKQDASLEEENIKKYIHDWPVKEIASYLGARMGIPLIDSTGIKENMDINFPDDFAWSDKKEIIEILKSMGFGVWEEEKIFDIVVISDKIGNKNINN